MGSTADAGSLKRGVVLLKLLATAGSRGLPLTELAAKSGVPHPSAHRVLKQLTVESLAEHNPETRRYRLGPLAFELGLAGSTMFDMRDVCVPDMLALSESTGDTVYLVARSGFDAVCMHRLEGSFPIRTLTLEVGSRRPLGVGAGGLAILAIIAEPERDQVIQRVAPGLHQFGGLTEETLASACKKARSFGASVVQDTVNFGVTAVGKAFRNTMGQPVAAISVAAMGQRMPAARIRKIAAELEVACRNVEHKLRGHQRGNWHAGG